MRALFVGILGALVAGCALLPKGNVSVPHKIYLLEANSLPAAPEAVCGVIQITNTGGESGFRTNKIAYMRTPMQIEYFAYARWAGAPDLLISAAARRVFDESGQFEAVIGSPASARSDLRLEIGEVRVLQRFDGEERSEIEMTIAARLYHVGDVRLLGTRRFEEGGPAEPSPEGAVTAANAALDRLMPRLLDFAVEACRGG